MNTPEERATSGGLELLAIRHAATDWNAQKRFQGHRDIALNEAGRQSLVNKQPPLGFGSAIWYVSPLLRARETARLLGIERYRCTRALIEMDWGDWEGERLPELRRRLGSAMQQQESLGLDLHPPGGESPRQVRARILGWLDETAFTSDRIGLLTHKGVIRAMLSAALDWDMRSACPIKLQWDKALLFDWRDGKLQLLDYNIPLSDV